MIKGGARGDRRHRSRAAASAAGPRGPEASGADHTRSGSADADAAASRAKRTNVLHVVGGLGAVIGTLAAGTSLIDWSGDKLRTAVPETIDASIVKVSHQGPAQLGDYLRDANSPRAGYSRDELRGHGAVFAVTVRLRGERGKRFPLRWFVVDTSGSRLRGRSFNQAPGDEPPVVFRPRNDDQRRTWPVWVPYPPAAGRYRVTFVLDDSNDQPVSQLPAALTVPAPDAG